jgi:hypothetical protein
MPKIGPTGEFPLGGQPINETDKGGIFVAMHVRRAERVIILNFNTTTDWLASSRSETLATAQRFRALVTKNFGSLSYDAATLPIVVTANHAKAIVECAVRLMRGSVKCAYTCRQERENTEAKYGRHFSETTIPCPYSSTKAIASTY